MPANRGEAHVEERRSPKPKAAGSNPVTPAKSLTSCQNKHAKEALMHMTVSIHLFLVVLALVLFALAGLGIPNPPRVNFLGWGLFCLTLSQVVVV